MKYQTPDSNLIPLADFILKSFFTRNAFFRDVTIESLESQFFATQVFGLILHTSIINLFKYYCDISFRWKNKIVPHSFFFFEHVAQSYDNTK